MTLGGLLALGYNVVVSYKRASKAIVYGDLSISLETIDTLSETYIVLRGRDRKMVEAEASRLGITGPWITKSYLEMILDSQGKYYYYYYFFNLATTNTEVVAC
ncbi:hypothetical protein HanHA300_Chr17g0673401 [Helianthus annuus]|nr:hypothetical protein HanHA300_Chr17g0673401 [Helianthus annuus]